MQFVTLTLGQGSLTEGFAFVAVEIVTEKLTIKRSASLPAAPDLVELYQQWRALYIELHSNLGFPFRIGIRSDLAEINNVSIIDFQHIDEKLCKQFHQWINAEFDRIVRPLLVNLSPDREIRILIQTDDSDVRRLPWSRWDLFQDFEQAEYALTPPVFSFLKKQKTVARIRILVILGYFEGSLESEQQALQRLAIEFSDVDVEVLQEPSLTEVQEKLNADSWQLFFFAGHSYTDRKTGIGNILINQDRSIKIGQLSADLDRASKQGLQLAIFNSCDGLGIVQELERLNVQIPQVVFMREPVPNEVARRFLTYFLQEFIQVKGYKKGQSLHLAVRKARERLKAIELKFPLESVGEPRFISASELPAIWHNLDAELNFKISLRKFLVQLIPQLWSAQQYRKYRFGFIVVVTVICIVLFGIARSWFFIGVPGIQAGIFNHGGSTVWVKIRQDIEPQIQNAFPNMQLRYKNPPSALGSPASGQGITMLLRNQLAFSQSSRALKLDELNEAKLRGFELQEVPIAIDGIAVIVNPELNIEGLTIDQLYQIYNGKIRNWRQLGGPDRQIQPYLKPEQTLPSASSYRTPPCGTYSQCISTTTEAVRAIATDRAGIFWSSASLLLKQCSVKTISLGLNPNDLVPPFKPNLSYPGYCDAIDPVNTEAFIQGKYPLTRRLRVIFREDGSIDQKAGEAYANLLLTPQGQYLLEKSGFAPLQPVKGLSSLLFRFWDKMRSQPALKKFKVHDRVGIFVCVAFNNGVEASF